MKLIYLTFFRLLNGVIKTTRELVLSTKVLHNSLDAATSTALLTDLSDHAPNFLGAQVPYSCRLACSLQPAGRTISFALAA
jgi:hypothetical protein